MRAVARPKSIGANRIVNRQNNPSLTAKRLFPFGVSRVFCACGLEASDGFEQSPAAAKTQVANFPELRTRQSRLRCFARDQRLLSFQNFSAERLGVGQYCEVA